jgi:hypothetical protein
VAFPTFISKLVCCATYEVDFLCGDGIEDKLVIWNEENISTLFTTFSGELRLVLVWMQIFQSNSELFLLYCLLLARTKRILHESFELKTDRKKPEEKDVQSYEVLTN